MTAGMRLRRRRRRAGARAVVRSVVRRHLRHAGAGRRRRGRRARGRARRRSGPGRRRAGGVDARRAGRPRSATSRPLAELRPLSCDRCQASRDPLRFFSCDEEGCRALAAAAPRDARVRVDAGAQAPRGLPGDARGRRRAGARRSAARPSAPGASRAPSSSCARAPTAGRRSRWRAAGGATAWWPRSAVRRRRRSGSTLGLERAAACVGPADASFEPGCEIFIAAQGAGGARLGLSRRRRRARARLPRRRRSRRRRLGRAALARRPRARARRRPVRRGRAQVGRAADARHEHTRDPANPRGRPGRRAQAPLALNGAASSSLRCESRCARRRKIFSPRSSVEHATGAGAQARRHATA